jgi:hypothetical protein
MFLFLTPVRMAQREIDQHHCDGAADRLQDYFSAARPLEHEPHDRNEADENRDTGQLAHPELLRRRLEQRRIAISQRLPIKQSENDRAEVAERRENEKARVTLCSLEITGDAEPYKEPDIHAGIVPKEGPFPARIIRGEPLGQHHIDAGHVEPAAREKESEPDVEERERAGRDASAADDLERHAADKKVPVRKEPPAQVTAEEVQPVVERAEHAHQRRGHFHRQLQMLRRVEDERRIKDGEPKRRKNLNEEQNRGSLRRVGEPVFDCLHRARIWAATLNNVNPAKDVLKRSFTLSRPRMERVGLMSPRIPGFHFLSFSFIISGCGRFCFSGFPKAGGVSGSFGGTRPPFRQEAAASL